MIKIAAAIVLVLGTAQASDVIEVRRVLADTVHEVQVGHDLRFWREVCLTENFKMTVARSIRDLNKEPNTFIKLPNVKYSGLGADGCQASIYSLTIPEGMEAGKYIYEPFGMTQDGEIIRLPHERFRVVE